MIRDGTSDSLCRQKLQECIIYIPQFLFNRVCKRNFTKGVLDERNFDEQVLKKNCR